MFLLCLGSFQSTEYETLLQEFVEVVSAEASSVLVCGAVLEERTVCTARGSGMPVILPWRSGR
jgi:hypothetical protein